MYLSLKVAQRTVTHRRLYLCADCPSARSSCSRCRDLNLFTEHLRKHCVGANNPSNRIGNGICEAAFPGAGTTVAASSSRCAPKHRLPGLRRDSRSPAMVPCQSTIAAAAVAVLTVAAISAATAFARRRARPHLAILTRSSDPSRTITSAAALQAAIDALCEGLRVAYRLPAGTVLSTASAPIDLDKGVAVRLVGDGHGVTIDGGRTTRLFDLGVAGSELVLENLHLTGGRSRLGGAIRDSSPGGASVRILDCRITDMGSVGRDNVASGGVIQAESGTSVEIRRTNISNVQMTSSGGSARGGVITSNMLVMEDVFISDVTVTATISDTDTSCGFSGGVLHAKQPNSGPIGSISISRVTITNVASTIAQQCVYLGGVLRFDDMQTPVMVSDIDVSGITCSNTLTPVSTSANTQIKGCVFGTTGSHLILIRANIRNVVMTTRNMNARGGVVKSHQSNVEIYDSHFENVLITPSGGTGTAQGGCVQGSTSSYTILNTNFISCRAVSTGSGFANGGGIMIHRPPEVTGVPGLNVTNCRFDSCSAETNLGTACAGGVSLWSGTARISGTIFTNNKALISDTSAGGRGEGVIYASPLVRLQRTVRS